MKIAWFKVTWLEKFILNNLPVGGEVQIMRFSRLKLGPKLKGRERPPWKLSWATFFFLRQVFFFLSALDPWYLGQNKVSTVAPLYALLRIRNRAKTKDTNFVQKSFNPEARLPRFDSSFFSFFLFHFIIIIYLFILINFFDFFFIFSFFWFFDFLFFLDCVCPN